MIEVYTENERIGEVIEEINGRRVPGVHTFSCDILIYDAAVDGTYTLLDRQGFVVNIATQQQTTAKLTAMLDKRIAEIATAYQTIKAVDLTMIKQGRTRPPGVPLP